MRVHFWDVIDAFNTTSRYLDDILNNNNVYFDNMVSQIYPSELQLNKDNASDTEAAFLDLHLSISNDIVSTKIYDKRDDFDFEIVKFPCLDGDVPRSTSYRVYISQLIRFARASSYVAEFSTRNKLLTQKLLKQGYRYHKLRKTFSKFYRRYYDLISKFQVGLKSLLRQGLSEPDFYGDLVYKLKKIVGSNNFSAQFIKIISHYKKIGYNINVFLQSACLVVNPITVGNFAFLFNCTPVGRTSDSKAENRPRCTENWLSFKRFQQFDRLAKSLIKLLVRYLADNKYESDWLKSSWHVPTIW